MRNLILAGCLGFSVTIAAPAFAQEDIIVVTGQRLQSELEDFDGVVQPELPYVSIKAPADFVMFTVSLESASNSLPERAAELERAYKALIARVGRSTGIEMEIGQPGFSVATETATAAEVMIVNARRSHIPVLLKFNVRNGETFGQVRTRAEAFIAGIEVTGRVEATTGTDQYIGLREPAKHRADLLRKIAEDTRLMQEVFAGAGGAVGAPGIRLTGLGGRVKTRPVGVMEIEMYIPYSIELGTVR